MASAGMLIVIELAELQHAYCKLNKQYQDKMAELIYANNRVEQYETEVKKLRFRVEDLKRGLNHAEDELDDSLNHIRKLQRSLDEEIKMNGNLQIQLNHLQSRLKRQKFVSSAYEIKLSAKYTSEDSTEAENEEKEDHSILTIK
ncbi:coiled-coil domain-containing protein 102A-like [Antechinus flavipes]|uniref:coiled-coil domain-containing protein 102A-like n=1 Tax=Antechinus flavipes TaxID=38775 RepID=UPI00223582D6|nr:coiled-coil domain-containing protein 102A-like [Antechinus flavipes]